MSEIISPVIEELAERAMAFTGGREGYYPTPIEGLSFAVHSEAGGACTCSVYEPSFALMLQGRKRSECGEQSAFLPVLTEKRGNSLKYRP